jgi:flotillin
MGGGIMITGLITVGVLAGLGVLFFMLAAAFRRVVPTNEVHIIQKKSQTVSYGKDTPNGNVYYEIPSWVPMLGIQKVILPVSVFDVDLNSYEAYDKGRLPFVVDVKAFFRIANSTVAAERVANFAELKEQLISVVQGAVRAILAGSEIEEIMQGRSKFGDEFTKEVKEQLSHWGVEPVKNIELMDLRDSKQSNVIHNIMEKKKSFIEMESRQEVARNRKQAEITEVESRREVDLQKQEALQQVGIRTAETERTVALANEKKKQEVSETSKLTSEKEMEVKRIQQTRAAEIEKQVMLVRAEQARETALINAEASKQTTVLKAEADFESTKRTAEGIALEGKAKAEAERAYLLAPVEAQTTLAKEIGSNKSYQEYLIAIEKVKAEQAVGMEQAKALDGAEIKIIANTGNASSGLKSVTDVFSSQGGTQIGAMLEGLKNTDAGKALMTKLGIEDQNSVA